MPPPCCFALPTHSVYIHIDPPLLYPCCRLWRWSNFDPRRTSVKFTQYLRAATGSHWAACYLCLCVSEFILMDVKIAGGLCWILWVDFSWEMGEIRCCCGRGWGWGGGQRMEEKQWGFEPEVWVVVYQCGEGGEKEERSVKFFSVNLEIMNILLFFFREDSQLPGSAPQPGHEQHISYSQHLIFCLPTDQHQTYTLCTYWDKCALYIH